MTELSLVAHNVERVAKSQSTDDELRSARLNNCLVYVETVRQALNFLPKSLAVRQPLKFFAEGPLASGEGRYPDRSRNFWERSVVIDKCVVEIDSDSKRLHAEP